MGAIGAVGTVGAIGAIDSIGAMDSIRAIRTIRFRVARPVQKNRAIKGLPIGMSATSPHLTRSRTKTHVD